ncbi:MAG: ABC transporter permease [Deltaproteobacteria bacterium]|nr:ABC transporter permease [Deltaproteobacteria bacterium]
MRDGRKTGSYPLIELTLARLREFVRSPGTIFWVFVFPVLLAVALGIAFRNQPPESPRVAIVDKSGTGLADRLQGSKNLKITSLDEEEARKALRTGNVDILVRVISGQGKPPSVIYRYDPTRPESRHARLALDDILQRVFGRADVISVEDEQVTEVGGRYIDFLIPGLIGLNVMSSCMWGIGYAVVDSRRRKLLKRFAATPMHRSHFLLSFIFSRMVFLVAEVAALVFFGSLVFDVQVSGSFFHVGLLTVAGAFAFSGIALLIAARPENTEVASGWMNFVMLPMWLLSGSFFAYSRFPEFMLPFIRMLPLTALNDGLRAVINNGASFMVFWMELAILLAWGLVCFVVALASFRWQ